MLGFHYEPKNYKSVVLKFICLPNNSKCEWRKLKAFVDNYNNKFHADYTLSECLDVFDSTRAQPEIKLIEKGKKDIG